MNNRDANLILAITALAEGDHDLARERLNQLSVAELRELVATSMMLNYLANETIDDKPRDLADEAVAELFRFNLGARRGEEPEQ